MKNFTKTFITFRQICLMCLVIFITLTKANAAQDSKGTDFWIAFPGNYSGNGTLTLFIAGDAATTGTVSVPGLAFSAPFSVVPGTITSVVLPTNAQLLVSDVVQNLGIHIVAADEVTVYGLNREELTTDAFLALPTDILGTDYINLGYQNVDVLNATQLAIVGTVDNTTVTIIPSVTTDGHPAGVPYNILLNEGQTYLLQNTGSFPNDLSGSVITSSAPVAVFGGHRCANIPQGQFACDYIVEQLPPTTAWGKQFVTVPLATRLNGDTFRFLASVDGTQIQVNGVPVATLNKGQYHEQIINGSAEIVASEPILVAQYSNSSSYDNVIADPFMMLIPPFEQFLGGYTVATPASGFSQNFINVVAPNAGVGTVKLDGVVIPSGSFSPIGSSGFSGAQLSVGLGTHTIDGVNHPIGAFVYGFDDYDSYGYPGGQSLAPIATVSSIALAPQTGSAPVGDQHCVEATVLDQFGEPVVGVRVDFNVSGANSETGFANTDANGVASFCYTGLNDGTDNIVASIGTLSDDAEFTWTIVPVCVTPEILIEVTRADNTYTGVGTENTIFLGYGAQSLTLTASNMALGAGTTTYTWSPATGLSTTSSGVTEFTPTAPGVYIFTVTAEDETCSETATITINVIDVKCSPGKSGKMTKIIVCHKGKEICISPDGVQDHLAHGCTLGSCTSSPSAIANSKSVNGTAEAVFYSYPTSFSDRATIVLSLVKEEAFMLEVFDMKGTLVKTIANGNAEMNKLYEFELNSNGMREGVYVTRLTTTSSVQSFKIVLKR